MNSDMDWSMDIPDTPTSPSLYILPASEHMSSPHVLPYVSLHNMGSNSKNSAEFTASVLDYGEGQLVITNS